MDFLIIIIYRRARFAFKVTHSNAFRGRIYQPTFVKFSYSITLAISQLISGNIHSKLHVEIHVNYVGYFTFATLAVAKKIVDNSKRALHAYYRRVVINQLVKRLVQNNVFYLILQIFSYLS